MGGTIASTLYGEECALLRYTAGMSEHTPPENPLSAAGRTLAAARRVVGPIACAVCGTKVIATTAGRPDRKRKYCSDACTQKAYRQRLGADYNARQRERRAQRRGQGPAPPSEMPLP